MKSTYCIYGIKNYEDIIIDTIKKHNLDELSLNLNIILTEGITNAFKHGNNHDSTAPINISIESKDNCNGKSIHISIKDCGDGFDLQPITNLDIEMNQLFEDGRGLFLIKQFCDELTVEGNSIHIYINP